MIAACKKAAFFCPKQTHYKEVQKGGSLPEGIEVAVI